MKTAPQAHRERHYVKRIGGVVQLDEVSHCGWALRLQKPTASPVSLFLLPADLYLELSATSPLAFACKSPYPTMTRD